MRWTVFFDIFNCLAIPMGVRPSRSPLRTARRSSPDIDSPRVLGESLANLSSSPAIGVFLWCGGIPVLDCHWVIVVPLLARVVPKVFS